MNPYDFIVFYFFLLLLDPIQRTLLIPIVIRNLILHYDIPFIILNSHRNKFSHMSPYLKLFFIEAIKL